MCVCVCVCVKLRPHTIFLPGETVGFDGKSRPVKFSSWRVKKESAGSAHCDTHTQREREGRPSMANAPLNPPAETNLLRTGIVALETGEIGYAAAAGSSGPGPSSASSRAGTSQPAIWRLAPAASCPSQELRRTDNYGAIRSKNCRNDDCSCHIETYRY